MYQRVIILPCAFGAASWWLYWLSSNLPSLENTTLHNSTLALGFPSDLQQLKALASVLTAYQEQHSGYVLLLYCTAYLYKQTFAIPGSVFLNVLGGALFGMWYAFPLVCVLTAIGATCCYTLARIAGKQVILKHFSQKISPLQKQVEDNSESLFFFLLFLRLFPMSPNWLLNMAAPVINIPLHQFFFSVLLGLMPYNFLCVQTGCLLNQLTSLNSIMNWTTFLRLVVMALVMLLPGFLFRKHRQNVNKDKLS